MNDLLKKKCVPCEGKGIKPFSRADAQNYLDETPGWALDSEAKKISKEYKFKDFIGAINFVERVADIAEEEGHHPNIHIHYNKVLLELSTHAIGGLSENDFIVATKIDANN
ncbi:pterin-4-alpha-carbinolamine dehydratase [Candidatus Nomurabacteria bacterium RIFCSPLOWO2_01_FULL_42_17]|uniref:Putative pterin-4-alpha-carbinolamine dehydratase n=1 Tax=Candidatus Nomurabacteria bacterium RIFCSPLOWO2_01_FULL_42_17 TaxID=1801780 RepID=A0A1F6XLF8_9BACT|nr:MAG: pterin-4-alpha-carbinolamine dehydratase [Candidatus Nomurabacteria bacterium RIFCSPLOWO2_01_FULL_42_17]